MTSDRWQTRISTCKSRRDNRQGGQERIIETSSGDISIVLKDRRHSLDMTLQELAEKSGISASYLGRLERGERFPSGKVLQKLAPVLQFRESELMVAAGLLSEDPKTGYVPFPLGRVDPVVARFLSQETIETQRPVVAVLIVMKAVARDVFESSCSIDR